MPIGHNLVTWTYLVAKDAGKCSHYPRWSMSIDKGENRCWGTISWLKGLQWLSIIFRMKFKQAPCHGLQNSSRSGPCRLLYLTLFYFGTPAFSSSSPPAGFYSVSFCLEHFWFLFAWLTTSYPFTLTSSWFLSLVCFTLTFPIEHSSQSGILYLCDIFDHYISHTLDCKLLFGHLCIPVSNPSPNEEERAKYTFTGWANEEMNTCVVSSTTGWRGGALTSTEPWLQNSLTDYLG